jgi:pimeloyl-ACP methyl ester carboxylesterase
MIHGYGGSKDSVLGLGLILAEAGLWCLLPDLPGHGDHPEPLGNSLVEEVRGAVDYARRYGPVLAIGHSLGGRLALLSGADAVVAISPALPEQPSPEGTYALKTFPTPRVNQEYPGQIMDILRPLPPHTVDRTPVLLVVGEEDIPSIVASVEKLAASIETAELFTVGSGMLFEVEEPPPGFVSYLKFWVNHGGLPANPEVKIKVAEWGGKALRGTQASRAK